MSSAFHGGIAPACHPLHLKWKGQSCHAFTQSQLRRRSDPVRIIHCRVRSHEYPSRNHTIQNKSSRLWRWGYRYAPTLIRRPDFTVDCWFCGGIATRTNIDLSTDHILYTLNWSTPEVVLCAKNEDSRTPNPLCNWLFKDPAPPTPTGDQFGVCDPSVIRFDGQYRMYYTAEAEGQGYDNQMFLATSSDGRNWVKHPNNSQPAQPILSFPDPAYYQYQHGKYGIGEASAIYKDSEVWMYYTYWPYNAENSVYLTRSTDGVNFSRGEKIFAEATIPFLGQGGGGGLDVKYIPGWNVFLYVAPTSSKQNLSWNVSRDGKHWLPWDSTSPFGHHTRQIALPRRYAISPAIEGDERGHIGDGTLASSQSTRIVFAAGDTDTPSDGFWLWTLDAIDITLTPQPLYGWLDGVDANRFAAGWAYDPDTGTNDAAANGGPSGPLGHDTWVRAIAVNVSTGSRYEGAWQSAQLIRDDLVFYGAAPDRYHGFSIDLYAQGFPTGTYRITVQGGEFPTGMGARELSGEATVTLP